MLFATSTLFSVKSGAREAVEVLWESPLKAGVKSGKVGKRMKDRVIGWWD